jgi:hypothetical protein
MRMATGRGLPPLRLQQLRRLCQGVGLFFGHTCKYATGTCARVPDNYDLTQRPGRVL